MMLKYVCCQSTAHVGRTHSGAVETDLLRLLLSVVDAHQPRLLQDGLVSGIHHDEGVGQGDGHALGLTVDTAADHCELQIELSCSLCEDEGLEGLSAVVDITAVICKGLVVDGHFASALCDIHLRLRALTLAVAVISVRYLSRALDFAEGVLGLLEGEEFELDFRVDGAIGDVVLVDASAVLVEDPKVIQIGVAIEVHGHFVEAEFESGGRRQFCQLFFLELDCVYLVLHVVLGIEHFLHIQFGPDEHFLAHHSLLDLSGSRRRIATVIKLVLHQIGNDADGYLLQCYVYFGVDILEVGLDQQIVLLVLVEDGVDHLVLVADVHGQVVGADHVLD